jgi:hypothetical protein
MKTFGSTLAAAAAVMVMALTVGVVASAQDKPKAGDAPKPEGKQLPHGAAPGQQIPMQADLARYVGRWQVGSAKEHTGREAVISWQWVAGKGGISVDLFFPTADGSDPVSTTHGILAFNPATGRIEATSIGGNGDYLRGHVFCDGNKHEWVWDTWSVAGGGKATSFRQVFTFAEDGKSYHCIAHVRKGLEWAKAFESTFYKIEKQG